MSFDYVTDENHETMKALVMTEGILFQDEKVKKFYIIIKYYMLDIFENLWNVYSDSKNINEYLQLLNSSENLIENTLKKKHETIEKDFEDVVILYAKFLFKGDIIRLKKPKFDDFLKAIFINFSKLKIIRNGTFFKHSMMDQDFIYRDLFRQTLFTDCIKITQRTNKEDEQSILPKYSVVSSYTNVTNKTLKTLPKIPNTFQPPKSIPVPSFKSIESNKSNETQSTQSTQVSKKSIQEIQEIQEKIQDIQKENQEKSVEKPVEVSVETSEEKLNIQNFEKNDIVHEKNDIVHEKNSVLQSFHSFSLPLEKPLETTKKSQKTPSEILLNYLDLEKLNKETSSKTLPESLSKTLSETLPKTLPKTLPLSTPSHESLSNTKEKCIKEDKPDCLEYSLSDEEVTEDDSISRVMEKMYLDTLDTVTNPDQKKKKLKKLY